MKKQQRLICLLLALILFLLPGCSADMPEITTDAAETTVIPEETTAADLFDVPGRKDIYFATGNDYYDLYCGYSWIPGPEIRVLTRKPVNIRVSADIQAEYTVSVFPQERGRSLTTYVVKEQEGMRVATPAVVGVHDLPVYIYQTYAGMDWEEVGKLRAEYHELKEEYDDGEGNYEEMIEARNRRSYAETEYIQEYTELNMDDLPVFYEYLVQIWITDPHPHLWIGIDNGWNIEVPVDQHLRISAPDDGEHVVRIVMKGAASYAQRWYPPLDACVRFLGYDAKGNGTLPTPMEAMAFVGDSITEGVFVDEDSIPGWDLCGNLVYQNDAMATYAWLASEKLGYEPIILGFGSSGVTRGGLGSVPKASQAYGYCFDLKPVQYPDPKYIVINHGVNDQSDTPENFKYEYDGNTIISGNGIDQYVELESRINDLPIKQVDNFSEYFNEDVIKCLLCVNPYDAECLAVELKGIVGDRADVFRSEPFYIEVMPKGVDKATSIAKLLTNIGVTREDVIACGDGFNDISMLRFAGIGVAMGNAQQPVKEVADIITGTNDENGLIPVIELLFE